MSNDTLADLDLYDTRAFADVTRRLAQVVDVRRGDGDTIALTSIEDDGEGSGDETLADIRAALGSAYTAEWTGDSETDEDGVTTSDVRIERARYPRAVAAEVAARRPDLARGDVIATVLTADPTLTADEVIEALDEAAAEFAAERVAS